MRPFVDAHLHFWQPGALRYPWLQPPFATDGLMGSVAPIAGPYGVAEYRADAAAWHLAGAVHVQAGADPRDALAETVWLDSLAASTGLPSGIVAFAALEQPGCEAALAAQAACGRVRGIRQIMNYHPDPFYTYTPHDLFDDPAWRRGFALLAKYRLSFDLQAYPHQFAAAARLFAANPDVPVMLNHAGMPLIGQADGFATWRAGMRRLAELKQVGVKLSGFGILDHGWTVDRIAPYVHEAIALFGTGRCMIASDFPTDRLYGDFDTTLGAYDRLTASASDDERADLFGRNANRLYRLGLDLATGEGGP